MKPSSINDPPISLDESPLYLLATLYSARKSRDIILERLTRKRLDALGVRVVFADELDSPIKSNGGNNDPR